MDKLAEAKAAILECENKINENNRSRDEYVANVNKQNKELAAMIQKKRHLIAFIESCGDEDFVKEAQEILSAKK